MRVFFAFALFLLAAAPLGAETYKWVDEKGVTNYSNAPPPSATGAMARVVEERVSTLPTDPALGQAIAAMRERAARQAAYEETEWLQRQRLLAMRASTATYEPCPYRTDCGTRFGAVYSYYPALYGTVFTAIRFRSPSPGFARGGTHARRGGGVSAHAGRGPR